MDGLVSAFGAQKEPSKTTEISTPSLRLEPGSGETSLQSSGLKTSSHGRKTLPLKRASSGPASLTGNQSATPLQFGSFDFPAFSMGMLPSSLPIASAIANASTPVGSYPQVTNDGNTSAAASIAASSIAFGSWSANAFMDCNPNSSSGIPNGASLSPPTVARTDVSVPAEKIRADTFERQTNYLNAECKRLQKELQTKDDLLNTQQEKINDLHERNAEYRRFEGLAAATNETNVWLKDLIQTSEFSASENQTMSHSQESIVDLVSDPPIWRNQCPEEEVSERPFPASNSPSEIFNAGTASRSYASYNLPKVPAPKAWGNGSDDDSVVIFLPRLKAYLERHDVSEDKLTQWAPQFLTGRAFQLWNLHANDLVKRQLPLTWEVFASFMESCFGAIAPEKLARSQYENLRQTGAVYSYIAEQRKLVQLMQHNPDVCPGQPDIIRQFLRNAKHDLRMYLIDKTPDSGYYSSCEEVYSKAINWQTNQKAKDEIQPAPKKLMHLDGTSRGNKGNKSQAKKAKTNNSYSAGFPGAAVGRGQKPAQPAKKQKTLAPKWTEAERQHNNEEGGCALCKKDNHSWTKCSTLRQRLRKDYPDEPFA